MTIKERSREELVELINQLEGQYLALVQSISDIRDRQTEILTTQIEAKQLICRIDDEAGFQTCPMCLARLSVPVLICDECGEIL